MAGTELKKDTKIVIVGAGVFGLSTTLHLLRNGYTNIHLFDKQPFDRNHYSEQDGADGASCDLNKIVRASYGGEQLYQDLAFKAMPEWRRWNQQLSAAKKEELPASLDPNIPLWHNSGFLRLSRDGLEPNEEATQRSFPKDIKHTQYRISDAQRRADAKASGIPTTKIDPFNRLDRNLPVDGILDMTAGYVLASRACTWALHLIQQSPHVKTYLGPDHGLQSLLKTGNRVTGIITTSIERHSADLTLIACGGWTPSLLPEVETLLEATSGSVLSLQLPPNRPDLWSKYSEENFPVWSWNMSSYTHPFTSIGGLYGLPRTPEGIVKVAFRGAKWPSYTRHTSPKTTTTAAAAAGASPPKSKKLSHPTTTTTTTTTTPQIPAEAMRVIRTFVAENLPDLLDLDLTTCRLCWYTDSIDNNFLIDYVPRTENLVVASGGSGHGFKFLPVLGEHVVDVIEGKDTAYTRLFAWRDVPEGERNGLEEGPDGWRALEKQKLAGNEEWRGHSGSKL